MVASRIYFSPSPCYRPRLCVHPMATSTPPTHPKTLIYLLDVSPSTTAFDPSAFISPPDERKFSAFTIPSAIVSLSSHSTEPDQIPPERSTQGEMSIFLLISLVRSVDRVCSWYPTWRFQFLFFFTSTGCGKRTAGWNTVMKDGFDALANNGRRLGETVSAFDLSLPLCCSPRSPLALTGVVHARGRASGLLTPPFEVRVCFRGISSQSSSLRFLESSIKNYHCFFVKLCVIYNI